MFNVYKNQQSRQTGSRNLMGPNTLPTIWHTYMKLVTKNQIPVINICLEKCDKNVHICSMCIKTCDQISDSCHQQLLRKMRRKISWMDGRTDRGKTVYPPPPLGCIIRDLSSKIEILSIIIGSSVILNFQIE